jgi:hypothetical protein
MVLVGGGDVAYLYASGIIRASDHSTYLRTAKIEHEL